MYNITVMDQYSPASVTVPANMSSVKISEFPDNGTSIVANREYTITVSAISDQGTSYPSDPVVVSKLSCIFKHFICTYIQCMMNKIGEWPSICQICQFFHSKCLIYGIE